MVLFKPTKSEYGDNVQYFFLTNIIIDASLETKRNQHQLVEI